MHHGTIDVLPSTTLLDSNLIRLDIHSFIAAATGTPNTNNHSERVLGMPSSDARNLTRSSYHSPPQGTTNTCRQVMLPFQSNKRNKMAFPSKGFQDSRAPTWMSVHVNELELRRLARAYRLAVHESINLHFMCAAPDYGVRTSTSVVPTTSPSSNLTYSI